MEDELDRLEQLLTGQLDSDSRDELETKLAIRPSLRRRLADMALDAPTEITLTIDEAAVDSQRIDLGPLIGKGGMATVRLGRQIKLDRQVAIKTLRKEFRAPEDIHRLLTEARITGRLEHPNIVPVHDIVRGEDGFPQVVLKLIEGHTWSNLMDDAERVRELFGAQDLLEWNLRVLMAVARALSFAHSKRVLHRDIKPGNVMVGPFGEVYVVDWGIAFDLDTDDDQSMPSGTSGYMAPEQFAGDDRDLGTWTDTYLLGATLFHILTGKPPNAGRDFAALVHDAAAGELTAPEMPEDVPAGLRAILRRALEPDPKRRTATPEQLRLSVTAFLEHRGATRLAARGDRERLRAVAASEANDERAWEHACTSAQLAYLAALEDWPACEEALNGARQLAALRVDHALERGDLPAAQRALESNDDLPAAYEQRVAEARAREADNKEQLRQIVADADRGFGHKLRGIFGAVFGLLWVGFWGVVAFVPPASVTPLIAFVLGFTAVGLVGIFRFAPALWANRINRTSMLVAFGGLGMMLVWLCGAALLALPMQTVIAGYLLICAFFTTGMATLMDPWGTVSALSFSAHFLVACARPAWTPYLVVSANVVVLLNQVVLNYARARRGFAKLPDVDAK